MTNHNQKDQLTVSNIYNIYWPFLTLQLSTKGIRGLCIQDTTCNFFLYHFEQGFNSLIKEKVTSHAGCGEVWVALTLQPLAVLSKTPPLTV